MSAQVVAVESNRETRSAAPEAVAGHHAPSGGPPPSRFTFSSGARPLDGYTIKRGIGYGGFGEIYYALSDAGKEVALKLVRRNLEVELRGIRHCLNLKHQNLLALYDIRQDAQGDTWVIMEFVSGWSLADAIAAHPDGLPPEEALAWLHGIAAGAGYLHDRGIVHRDLKPANIFSEEGTVKVGDYGLAKFISCSRRSGHTESIGTVHYMAPEVANGRYGKEIDVYAMGVILYEMLTGRVPFDGESVGEVLTKHLTAQPDVSMLAEPFRNVVARALEKDPEKRFRSIGEMMARLPATTVQRLPPVPSGAGQTDAAQAAGPLADTIVYATAVDDEPILRFLRQGWWRLRTAWDQANLPRPLRLLMIVAGIWLLLASAAEWIPIAIGLSLLYGVYRVVRVLVPAVMESGRHGPTSRVPPPGNPAPLPAASPVPRHVPTPTPGAAGPQRWARSPRPETPASALVVKPPRQRAAELLGSLLVGAMVTLAMSVVLVLLYNFSSQTTAQPEQIAWLVLVGMAGTFAVLIVSKFWEGSRGDAAVRRFILLVLGLGIGALSAGAAAALMVDLPFGSKFPKPPDYSLPTSFYGEYGHPLAMAHLAVFGTLFLLLRWWRQADPLRSTRLSLWSLLVCSVVAALVAGAWVFPQPWLPMVAAMISVAVQLSSPWVPPHERVGGRR